MLLKHPLSERAENKPVVKNIYDAVKKRTQKAVLITVDGNNTVVNMAEQPSKYTAVPSLLSAHLPHPGRFISTFYCTSF